MARLDPVSLQLFISVVEEGTIAGGAGREHIATASVSKRISDLEEILRTPLLTRSNKGVKPTPAGVALLALARRVLYEMDQIPVHMQGYASGARGMVRICASTSALTQFLPAEIESFLMEHPHVQVQIEEGVSSVIPKAIAENAADIGIFTLVSPSQDLEILPYHSDQLVLVTPRDHPLANRTAISFSETLDYDYIGLHGGSAISQQLLRAASLENRLIRLRMQITSHDAVCLMVNSGLGIAVLPQAIAAHHAETLDVRIIPLSDHWARRDFKIGVRSFQALPRAVQLMVRHLQKCAR